MRKTPSRADDRVTTQLANKNEKRTIKMGKHQQQSKQSSSFYVALINTVEII